MTNTTEVTPPGKLAGPHAQAEPAKFELARYDRACRALAEARSVDEVKDVRDVAMAMKLYAKQAKNRQMEADAYELRVRAERKLGEMIAAQKETVGLNVGGRPKTGTLEEPVSRPGTLAEAGIDKKLSSRAQKISAIPPAAFAASHAPHSLRHQDSVVGSKAAGLQGLASGDGSQGARPISCKVGSARGCSLPGTVRDPGIFAPSNVAGVPAPPWGMVMTTFQTWSYVTVPCVPGAVGAAIT